jgi:endoglucanase
LQGLSWADKWGSLRHVSNTAFLALIYANAANKGDASMPFVCWSISQLRYILGDTGRSFVVGVGKQPPCQVSQRLICEQPWTTLWPWPARAEYL